MVIYTHPIGYWENKDVISGIWILLGTQYRSCPDSVVVMVFHRSYVSCPERAFSENHL